MSDAGTALIGIGMANGENRAVEAAKEAISSPLLEESVEGASGILLNVTGAHDLGLFEVNEAAEIIASAADANANIIFGAVIDDGLQDEVRVTVIATGFHHRGPGGLREGRLPAPRDRGPRVDDRQRSVARDLRRRHRHPVVPARPVAERQAETSAGASRRSASTAAKASTTRASNWLPAQRRSSASASSSVLGFRR